MSGRQEEKDEKKSSFESCNIRKWYINNFRQ